MEKSPTALTKQNAFRRRPPLQTMHTHGVLKPEGVKLRVVKASGRALEDTKFHMEIRTLRPGQVSA